MEEKEDLELRERFTIRYQMHEETQEKYYLISDVCKVLIKGDYQSGKQHWKILKNGLKSKGDKLIADIIQLEIEDDKGKMQLSDVANEKQLLRLIKYFSPEKQEQFKSWLSHVKNWKYC